tara:strand:+ start:17469 stop:17843 length:375 start_codon:yes stop_codon:yes gene_type:complete
MKNKRNFDLQDRLINFSLTIMKIVDRLPKTYNGQHFAKQLIRSGTSPSFQYGEAQAAESRKDFIHKLKIGQKELKETYVCLTLIKKHPLLVDTILDEAISECDQLAAIFFKSISTAQINLKAKS